MTVILVNAEALRIPLPAGVVHCSVSSPPYGLSLRAYQGDQARDWPRVEYKAQPGRRWTIIPPMTCALGHEPTPEAFIGHLVACYREVKRVLRDDGVCWVVIGDSSASKPQQDNHADPKAQRRTPDGRCRTTSLGAGNRMLIPHRLALALQADGWIVRNDNVWHKVAPMPESVTGTRWERCRVKVEDLDYKRGGSRTNRDRNDAGVACNLSYAKYTSCPGCPRCEAHGGYVLRRGSWRHTIAHEDVLMLTKKMGYFSDQEAVREGLTEWSLNAIKGNWHRRSMDCAPGSGSSGTGFAPGKNYGEHINPSGRNPRSVLIDGQPVDFTVWLAREYGAEFADEMMRRLLTQMGNPPSTLKPKPSSYSGKHYATYPPDLIRPLIKSSCPTRCCPVCGAGWAVVIERTNEVDPSAKGSRFDQGKTGANGDGRVQEGERYLTNAIGYRPTCDCRVSTDSIKAEFGVDNIPDAVVPKPVPGLVLDPFFGSGTTGIVAREEGMKCIGLDLSYDYLHDQARARLELDAWDAWHEGRDGKEAASLEKLPLFKGMGT